MQQYQLDGSSVTLSLSRLATSGSFRFPGATPSISAAGNGAGIVWELDNSQFCTPGAHGCGPAVLHAYLASDISTELWNSAQSPEDAAGFAVKFTVPTIANGRVFIGTRGDNTGGTTYSSAAAGQLDIYGLRP